MTIIWCMVPEIWSVMDTSVPKIMIICYSVPEIQHVTDKIFIFRFGLFFDLTPLTTQKIRIFKKWKKRMEISSFHTCVPKIMITWCTMAEIWCATDGRTDGCKKWHIEVFATPKSNNSNKKKTWFKI